MAKNQYDLLVVEDQQAPLDLILDAYQGMFIIHTARTVDEAASILRSVIPDMVLTDLDLPEKMEGLHVLGMVNVLREEQRYGNLETAVMSGRQRESNEVKQAIGTSTSKIFLKKPEDIVNGAEILYNYLSQLRK